MKAVGILIREAREKKDCSQRQLALYTGISNTEISKIESGERQKPSPEILKKIADYLNLDYMDLLLAAGYIDHKYMSMEQKQMLPILDAIQPGIPLLSAENHRGQIETASGLKADFALYIEGDSMSWVGLHEGDVAIIKQSDTAQHGQIVAAVINTGELKTILRFYIQEKDACLLKAANPSYPDMKISSECKIIGTLVSIQKQSPSLTSYTQLLHAKESFDSSWSGILEKALAYGLDADSLDKYLDVLYSMKKL